MSLRAFGDLLVCAAGIYLTLGAYRWLPLFSRSDEQTDEENERRKLVPIKTIKVIGPPRAILGLLRFLLAQHS